MTFTAAIIRILLEVSSPTSIRVLNEFRAMGVRPYVEGLPGATAVRPQYPSLAHPKEAKETM